MSCFVCGSQGKDSAEVEGQYEQSFGLEGDVGQPGMKMILN